MEITSVALKAAHTSVADLVIRAANSSPDTIALSAGPNKITFGDLAVLTCSRNVQNDPPLASDVVLC